MRLMGTPSDSELDIEPVEREGHETLLPSVTRSMLSTKSFVSEMEVPPPTTSATGSVAPNIADAVGAETERPRGARSGDIVGGRYVVEGQLGRGGMGRVLRVRHSALGKPFAL